MSQIPHRETINPFHLRLFVDDNDGVDFATAHLQLPSDLKGEETCEAVAREDARPGALVLMQHFYKRAHEFFQPGNRRDVVTLRGSQPVCRPRDLNAVYRTLRSHQFRQTRLVASGGYKIEWCFRSPFLKKENKRMLELSAIELARPLLVVHSASGTDTTSLLIAPTST